MYNKWYLMLDTTWLVRKLQEGRDFCRFVFALVSSVMATCLACGIYSANIYWMNILLIIVICEVEAMIVTTSVFILNYI